MSDDQLARQRIRRAVRRIRLAFAVSVLGSAAFATVYALGGQPQVEGAALAVAFVGLAYGLAAWAKHLLLAGANPIAGPAGRPLPGLPIAVDADGYLYARGDFTAPPGPGFWSLP